MNTFYEKLVKKWDEQKFVCVGLDSSDFSLIKKVVDQTADLVCAFKINSAFFEATGTDGLQALKKIIPYIHSKYSDIPVILDAKRGDIDNTNEAYAKSIFDDLQADAVTVQPLLGKESLEPFLGRIDKGIFVLIKTSNQGADEFQDLDVVVNGVTKPLYRIFAEHVKTWNSRENVGVVVGATHPEDLKEVRQIVGDMPILVPGIGAQGGDLKATLENGLDSHKTGLIINSSRGIIFADNPREAALKLHQEIVSLLT